MPEIPQVLSSAELAEMFKMPESDVIAAFESGTLKGFKIGTHWRTTVDAVLGFIHQEVAAPPATGSAASTRVVAKSKTVRGVPTMENFKALSWVKKDGGFDYLWPREKGEDENGEPLQNKEVFDEAYQATILVNGQDTPFVIGFCDRKAAGMDDRRRAVVFKGELGKTLYPLVEFAGANDFAKSGTMVSTIRVDGRKALKPGEAIPEMYADMPLAVYNEVVVGPYAMSGMAVVAHKTDFAVMLRHAVIRMLKAA
jgi:hypothetical protein